MSTMEYERQRAEQWKAKCEAAEAELAEIKEVHARTVSEPCEGTDIRQHCSCVPALRARIAKLEAMRSVKNGDLCKGCGRWLDADDYYDGGVHMTGDDGWYCDDCDEKRMRKGGE